MLQQVVLSSQAGILTLPVRDPSLGYDIQNIEGLDPVKATLVSSSFAQQDGAQYQSSRRETRNLIFTLGMYPDYATDSVMSLRQKLQALLMPKKPVSCRFVMSNGLTVDIDGRVETNEASMFVQDPEATISIECFDPDFVDPVTYTFNGTSTSGSTYSPLVYPGTVEAGIILTINVNRTVGAITIYHQTPDGSVKTTDIQLPLVAGDILTMSTIPGDKYINLQRGGVTTSPLYGVSPQSNWIELENGTNGIRVYASGAGIPYTINYKRRYGGL